MSRICVIFVELYFLVELYLSIEIYIYIVLPEQFLLFIIYLAHRTLVQLSVRIMDLQNTKMQETTRIQANDKKISLP